MQEVGVVMAEGEKRVDSELEVEALGIAVSAAEDCVYYAAAAAQLGVVRVGVPDRVWQLLREGELAACGPE